MPKFHRLLLLSSALLLLAIPATAEDPPELITDRPDQTESPNTVPLGFYQLELGATFNVNEIGSFRNETLSVPETLLRIGLSDRLELRLGWSGVQVASTCVCVGSARPSPAIARTGASTGSTPGPNGTPCTIGQRERPMPPPSMCNFTRWGATGEARHSIAAHRTKQQMAHDFMNEQLQM